MTGGLDNGFVFGSIPGLAFALISLLTALRRKGTTEINGHKVLEYGIGIKLFAVYAVALILFLGSLPFTEAIRNPGRLKSDTLNFLSPLIILIPMLCVFGTFPLEVFFRSLSYDQSGIYVGSIWRKYRFVPWTDINEYFEPTFNSPFVRLRSGGKIKIWRFRDGFPEFLDELKARNVPGAAAGRS